MLYSSLSLDLIMLILELHHFLGSGGRLGGIFCHQMSLTGAGCSALSEPYVAVISFAHVESSEKSTFKFNSNNQTTC